MWKFKFGISSKMSFDKEFSLGTRYGFLASFQILENVAMSHGGYLFLTCNKPVLWLPVNPKKLLNYDLQLCFHIRCVVTLHGCWRDVMLLRDQCQSENLGRHWMYSNLLLASTTDGARWADSIHYRISSRRQICFGGSTFQENCDIFDPSVNM